MASRGYGSFVFILTTWATVDLAVCNNARRLQDAFPPRLKPNLAVLYFPYNWLPSAVVHLVLFSHLAGLWQLLSKRDL